MSFNCNFRQFALYAAVIIAVGSGFGAVVKAQEPMGLMPPAGASVSAADAELPFADETHPPLRLTPDQSQILTVGEDMQRVIIGNEFHLNILMDSARRVVVVPRAPGATYFTILGENGKVLMQRYAIVAAPSEKYIRVRQTCAGQPGCAPVRMFYCPNMCHEMAVNSTPRAGSSPSYVPPNETGTASEMLDPDNDNGDEETTEE